MRRVLLAVIAVLMLTASQAIAAYEYAELDQSVPGHARLTYLDLARLVFADLHQDDGRYAGTPPEPVRHLVPGYEAAVGAGTVRFTNLAVTPARAGGKERLVVLIDVGTWSDLDESLALLCLFGFDDGAAKLLDVVNVGLDQSTFFRDPGTISLGASESAVATSSQHFNSNQSYDALALALIRNDRFEHIDDFWLISDRACGWARYEVPTFSGQAVGNGFGDFTVTITDTLEVSKDAAAECGDEKAPAAAYSTEYRATYTWDPAQLKYTPDSDAIEKLEKRNEDRL
ncbi:MAG TPA: hypothetical protein VMF90_17585 [Rhizobiaceae bacterium]|nr:hypothetical protein [Rhizobiaceae bacterium]